MRITVTDYGYWHVAETLLVLQRGKGGQRSPYHSGFMSDRIVKAVGLSSESAIENCRRKAEKIAAKHEKWLRRHNAATKTVNL